MSTFTHTDRDGDSLTIRDGEFAAVVSVSDNHSLFMAVAVRRQYAVDVALALLEAAGINAAITCPGCRNPLDDEGFGRDENCEECSIDGAPLTQEEVTAP